MSTAKSETRFSMNGHADRGIDWNDDIPDDGPELFVLRMKGNKCLTFTCWAKKIVGVTYHWVSGHSQPHLRDEKKCPGCLNLQPKKWKGYLHVYCSEMRQEVFLEITPGCGKALKQLLVHRVDWRGAVFQLKRVGADNGKLIPHILSPCDPGQLPVEKDPRPSLLKLWGLTEEQIDEWLNGGEDGGGPSDFV